MTITVRLTIGLEVEDSGSMLEVDGSMLWARGRRAMCLRSMAVWSGSGMRRWRAPRPGSRRRRALRPGMRQRHAPWPRLRTAGGSDALVSRVTEGRALGGFSKNSFVLQERARGLKY
jgi:hypothetical protein